VTNWCGPGRQGNLFALRAVDAYDIVNRLRTFFMTGNRKAFNDDMRKRAAQTGTATDFYGLTAGARNRQGQGFRGQGQMDMANSTAMGSALGSAVGGVGDAVVGGVSGGMLGGRGQGR
jgi:hypothetical protein